MAHIVGLIKNCLSSGHLGCAWLPLDCVYSRRETLERQSPTLLAPGTCSVEDSFFMDRGLGCFRSMIIVHFMSVITTSAPPQIIRFQTLRTLALEGKAWLPCAPKLLLTETPSLFF